MPRYRIAPQAERDIEMIPEWTLEEFGDKARLRYEALLTRAIVDAPEGPKRAGSRDRPEIAAGARTYHLRHSRERVGKSIGRVLQPRHFLLYRITSNGQVEIGRILHDGMGLIRHLPDDYRAGNSEEPGPG